jgi:acyl-coenzyme A thioesterase PaaI-like protein
VAERPDPARFCFGCGTENPRGLGLKFRLEHGRAVAEFTPAGYLQGYPGFVHGGGVATMLDEAMGWAVYGQGIWAMTARLTMRFRRSVPLNEPLVVSGWMTRDRGRFLELRAELRSREGALLAQANGLFVRVDGEQAEKIRRQYEAARA